MTLQDNIAGLAKGLNKFRSQLKQPMKDADNPFFKSKYVPLEAVTDAIDKALAGTGLAYYNEVRDGKMFTIIIHEDGGVLEVEGSPVIVGGKKDAQAYGSAMTYARRYSLSNAFGITSDADDDGNSTSGNTASYAPKQRTQPKPKGTSQKIIDRAKERGFPDADKLAVLGDEKATAVVKKWLEDNKGE